MESTIGMPKPRESGKLLPFSHFPFHPAASTTYPMQSGGKPTHHNITSEVVEEQPAWLDDLLNDSGALFHRGHRRSASDSCAYLGAEPFALDDESDFVNAYFGSPPESQSLAKFKQVDNIFSQTKVRHCIRNMFL